MSSATSASAIAMLNVRRVVERRRLWAGGAELAHQTADLEHEIRLDDEVDVAERAARRGRACLRRWSLLGIAGVGDRRPRGATVSIDVRSVRVGRGPGFTGDEKQASDGDDLGKSLHG